MANFDSYYYLQIAKEIQNGNYDGFHENRYVPNGMPAPKTPPLPSILAASISNLTGLPIQSIAIFLPIFLASLLAPIVFLYCRKIRFNLTASLTTALFSILSIAYVVRTRIGVFDTDSLNVSFVLLNSYFFSRFAELKTKKRFIFLGLGLLNTILFYLWWNTAISIVILSAVLPLAVALLFYIDLKKLSYNYALVILLLGGCAYFIRDQLKSIFNLVLRKNNSSFPNNMDISELDPVSVSNFIERTTQNSFISLCMVVGLIILTVRLKRKALFLLIPFILSITALFTGNRFVLFSAPILALGFGQFIHLITDKSSKIKPSIAISATAILIVTAIASVYKTLTDGVQKPAAYENVNLLNAIEYHTPEDANIWTDWDLGYQIQYYLERGTFADGGFTDGEAHFYVAYPLGSMKQASFSLVFWG